MGTPRLTYVVRAIMPDHPPQGSEFPAEPAAVYVGPSRADANTLKAWAVDCGAQATTLSVVWSCPQCCGHNTVDRGDGPDNAGRVWWGCEDCGHSYVVQARC